MYRQLVGAHRPIPGNGAPQIKQVLDQSVFGGAGYGIDIPRVRYNEQQFSGSNPARNRWSLWDWIRKIGTR